MPGIFISRGMSVGVPAGGLVISIGDDGKPTANCTLHVHFDVCPTWLELAQGHLNNAKARQAERAAAWAGPDQDARAASLEREFEASMQAIMAAAIACDAFYAVIQKKAGIPDTQVTLWREKRTARHKQIAEVLRIAFGLKNPKNVASLRQSLKEIYRMRDAAVHPSGKLNQAIEHPELNVGVEWRFAYFRYANADAVVRAATELLSQIVTNGKPRNKAVRDYANAIRERLEALGIVAAPSVPQAKTPKPTEPEREREAL